MIGENNMRTVKNINENWLFTMDEKADVRILPQNAQELNLPHTWNGEDGQDGGNDYKRQKCFYFKEIGADCLTGEENFLEFDAVNSSAEVFWNGKSVFVHHGGYSRFRVRIPENDIKEKNILTVSADNSPNETVYPQNADFTFYGGIYRSVKIVSVPKAHFDLEYYGAPGVTVTPVVKGTDAEITIESYSKNSDGAVITYKILDGENVVCETQVQPDNAKAVVTIENVHLWNGRKDPHLYTLEASLEKDGEVLDTVSARFGCRSFRVDPEKGFILNGKEYPLRGVSRHQDYPRKGNALTPEDHARDIELICEMGANTIRLAHYQHAQEFYDLCDEKGLVIWAEIPYISRHMHGGYDNTISQMKELVLQNYNHASICFWGLSNEITIAGADDPHLIKNHRDLNDLVHKLDPIRLTTLASVTMCSMDNEYVHIPDILSYNHYFGWYGGTTDMNGKWFDEFHKKYPNKPIGLSEYGCEALNWHTSNPTQGDYTEEYQSYYHEELIKQIAVRPYIWATHVWNMFDFAADARAEGGENGMNHKGLITFDRQYKKDSFYAYKAWLNPEPMVHICSKRYIDRVEDVTKVTVYSNCDEVELFRNGESVGKQKKGDFPFFYFEVKNEGTSTLEAKAGALSDTSTINKVDAPNEDYIMKEENQVINWFEINTPAGYYSINDSIGDIMSTFRGKIVLLKLLLLIKNVMSQGSKDGKAEVMGFSFGKINMSMIKSMYGMVKGFTVKRAFMMLGGKFSKEQILEVNAMLNKVKKKK